jgi:hypothetical protein
MIGTTVSHDRILNKFDKCKRRGYLSRPECGSLRQGSTNTPNTPAEAPDHNSEQLAPIKLYAEFCQLNELQRG